MSHKKKQQKVATNKKRGKSCFGGMGKGQDQIMCAAHQPKKGSSTDQVRHQQDKN